MSDKEILDWEWYKSRIYVDSRNRICLPHVSIDITCECNMRCEQCSHLSPFMKGHFPKNDIIQSMSAWSSRLHPLRVGLLGGEPLLHPDFVEIAIAARTIWAESKIIIVTNGLNITKLPLEVLLQFSNLGHIGFSISQHVDSPEWTARIERIKTILSELNLPFHIRRSYSNWMVAYRTDDHGRYIPWGSVPEAAWKNCWGKSFCKIHNNGLWYCTRIVSAVQAYEVGLFGNEWKKFISHKPMSSQNSTDEILSYLKSEYLPECSMCSEEKQTITPRQLS